MNCNHKYTRENKFKFFILFLLSVFFKSLIAQTQPDYATDPRYIEAMSVVDNVASTNNYAGNFNPDSLYTLPFGIMKEIGATRYVIAIDSAVFLPGIALYSAYMAVEFPGSMERIAFSGKNIAFNPKGVIPGNNTRLMLASDQKIHIGPKVQLILKADGNNYVEWDCNGFKAIRMKGSFEFHNSMLEPDPSATKDSTVKASFDIYTNDIHNFITQVSITPFSIKGLKDIFFSATDATVDMSEFSNAPGMIFPSGYDISNIGPDINMWSGFYMKQLKIKLPKEISKNNTPTEVLANNFFIDKSGLTGNFQATNLFSVSGSTMSGWGFSIDQIGLNFVSNNLNGGNLGGKILLPLNHVDGVSYTASVFQNPHTQQTDFSFSISPVSNYTASVLSATIDVYSTSKITVQKINGTFKPSADLNGKITFSHEDVKTFAIEMQHVILITDAPYLKSGMFSFTNPANDSLSASLAGFKISFNSINVLVNNTNPGIGFGIGVSFTSKNDLSFGAAADFNILASVIPNSNSSMAPILNFYKVDIKDIAIDIKTTAFQFNGVLRFKNNDILYGKGFAGSLSLTIPDIMPNPATSNVWFGTKNSFNYFYFDQAIPSTIVLIPPGESPEGLAIYRLMGGLYYHMKPPANLSGQLYTNSFGTPQTYIPDSTMSIGLKAGVTLGAYPTASLLNGDINFEINFTSSGGLGVVKFFGPTYMFIKIADRTPVLKKPAPVIVDLLVLYDQQNKIFTGVLNTHVNLPNTKSNAQSEIYMDPKVWHFCLGKPQNRINLNLAGFDNLSAYIMMGTNLDPVPMPPTQVSNIFGHGYADKRDQTKLNSGSGFVFGASFGGNTSGSFGMNDFGVYYNFVFTAGFDVMAIDYGPKTHCSNSSDPTGFNGWYAQGDIYASLNGVVGAKGKYADKEFDIQLLSLSAAAMLTGKFPNPSHLRGDVAVNYNFLDVFKGSFNFSYGLGSECNIVSN
jgi:hypothetical protein